MVSYETTLFITDVGLNISGAERNAMLDCPLPYLLSDINIKKNILKHETATSTTPFIIVL